jgi:hypothetical protein
MTPSRLSLILKLFMTCRCSVGGNSLKRIFEFALVPGYVVLSNGGAVVGAFPSQAVSGRWQFASRTSLSAQPVDSGNCVIEAVAISNLQGDLVGTFTDHLRIVRRAQCDHAAAEVFQTDGTYQGTVAGVSGTFDLQGKGQADAQGNVQGHFIIQGGTGALAYLHGVINLTGSLVTGGTYSGNVHFD